MADILIRKIPDQTKARLQLRASRRGRSLEAELREALERLALEEVETPDAAEPLGSWLVAVSRPGADLTEALEMLRSAPVRTVIE